MRHSDVCRRPVRSMQSRGRLEYYCVLVWQRLAPVETFVSEQQFLWKCCSHRRRNVDGEEYEYKIQQWSEKDCAVAHIYIYIYIFVCTCIYIYKFLHNKVLNAIMVEDVSKVGDHSRGWPEGSRLHRNGGHHSFPWIVPLYPWSLPYNAEC